MIRYEDDFIVNGINLTPYLTSITISYSKLWGSDTGRNTLSGKYSGTLIGIFPKFECQFRRLTQQEMEYLIPILDTPIQTTTYYDPNKKQKLSIETYTGDLQFTQKNIFSKLAKAEEPFSISFIATSRR